MQPKTVTKMTKHESYATREEWLEARKSFIGGSDASAIMGMNPYKTNVELWLEKTGQFKPEDISNKPYVRYGTEAEDYLRELFRLDYPQYEVFYEPNNMWTNDEYPWAHASLDGWLFDRESGRFGILEIKTTNILQSMQKEKWHNRIPDNYYCQLLHYLMVTGFDFCILKAQLKTEFNGDVYLQTKHYTVEKAEVQADLDELIFREQRFAELVKDRKRPGLILPQVIG